MEDLNIISMNLRDKRIRFFLLKFSVYGFLLTHMLPQAQSWIS